MAQLAIKGHATRGSEVIELLEMLGGKNKNGLSGDKEDYVYTINKSYYNEICCFGAVSNVYKIFTLEEFLEKFPYKIGDKVLMNGIPKTIKGINWDSNSNEIVYKVETNVRGFTEEYHVFAYDIQPYKEETMEENRIPPYMDYDVKSEETMEDKGTLVQIDLTREICVADEVEVILGDYEFVLKDGKTFFVKKKPQYPKTYEECCEVMGIDVSRKIIYEEIPFYKDITLYEENIKHKLEALRKLLICRDAYWKIAEEQMGLGEPWEPDFLNPTKETRYFLFCTGTTIENGQALFPTNKILIFPTAEMRDAFFENFDKDIDLCKEFV